MQLVDLGSEDPRWDTALPVLQELRPHLDRAAFEVVYRAGWPQGLRFTAAYDDGPDDSCLGVAGWRVVDTTAALRKLYVDDLVTTHLSRSNGVGRALLALLEGRARAAGCATLELDSGVQRFDAHRFYLRERFAITSHHFTKPLPPSEDDAP
jgi:GNAT superfamily N-acetyltransferase